MQTIEHMGLTFHSMRIGGKGHIVCFQNFEGYLTMVKTKQTARKEQGSGMQRAQFEKKDTESGESSQS